MAITAECDRCHETIKGEVLRRGYVVRREYCEVCVEEIDVMLSEIDELHDNMAAQWDKKIAKIRASHNTKGGLLPDVSV